jgi:hypothetical protein
VYLDEHFDLESKIPDDDYYCFVCWVENLICPLNADFQHGEEKEILAK